MVIIINTLIFITVLKFNLFKIKYFEYQILIELGG